MNWFKKPHEHRFVRTGVLPNGFYKYQCMCRKVLIVMPKEWLTPIPDAEWEDVFKTSGYMPIQEIL